MKRLFISCIIVVIAHCPAMGQQGVAINPLTTTWARAHNIDIHHIAIDLRFNWQKKNAYGNAIITLSPFNATSTVALDAGMLTINTISFANGQPLTFTYDGGDKNDGLVIHLDRIYTPADTISIKIEYHTNRVNESDPNNIWGSFGKGIRFFSPTSTEPKKRRQLWTSGEPEGNRYWFPCYDYPNDLRTTTFTATVEKPLAVISNGIPAAIKENNDGTRSFCWKTDTPYANHLTSFIVGEYDAVKQQHKNIPLYSFSYPNETEAAVASVVRLPDMVQFFENITGTGYPFAGYSQVFVPDFAGWESNMAVSTITENMVDDESTHADYFYLWDITEGEALAHQWFGTYITNSNWNHCWLNKSFARYFSGLYNEYKNGRDEFLSYQLLPDHNTYLADWNAGIRQPIVNNQYANAEAATGSNYPYIHGASVLHMLRKHLGDDNWRKAIQNYVRSNAGKLVTTEDFRKAIEASCGEPMDWFFDQWLYRMGHPVFKVTKQYDDASKQLTINVTQTQQPDSASTFLQNNFFRGKMDIEIDDSIVQVWLQPVAQNTFSVALSQAPRLVNVDYQGTWIKEMEFEKTTAEYRYQLLHSKDILARMHAITELVKQVKNNQLTAAEKEEVYSSFRTVITSTTWWRLRATALSQLQNIMAGFTTTQAVVLDKATTTLLLTLIKKEKSWIRTGAIRFLGMTRNPAYANIYINAFKDESARVNNAAAIALGKSKSTKAYAALIQLKDKPSWKSQSLISSLNGLKELGDSRGVALALQSLANAQLPHWTLAVPVWDHRLAAAETLVALGNAADGYSIIRAQFNKAMEEGDINDIFYNVLQVTTLADPQGAAIFPLLKNKFKDDANAMAAVNQYETQFKQATQKSSK